MVLSDTTTQLLGGFMLAQLAAGILYVVRQDKRQAVERAEAKAQIEGLTKEVSRLAGLLETHNPLLAAAAMASLTGRIEHLEADHRAHHRLIRHINRRLDRANVADLAQHSEGGDE